MTRLGDRIDMLQVCSSYLTEFHPRNDTGYPVTNVAKAMSLYKTIHILMVIVAPIDGKVMRMVDPNLLS
jgi:hypothetical protein